MDPAKERRIAKILQELIRTRGMRCSSNLSDYSFSSMEFKFQIIQKHMWNRPGEIPPKKSKHPLKSKYVSSYGHGIQKK